MLHNFIIKKNKLFIGGVSAESLVKKYGSPLYVYDANIIRQRYQDLVTNITYPNKQIHFACKTNTNPELLKLLRAEGASIETVSKQEVLEAFRAGYEAQDIIYTCSNITKEELQFLIEQKIMINLDSLNQIKKYGELHPGGKICIRINQGIGGGHHKHCITGGQNSKFGIDLSQVDEAKRIAQKYNISIVGIHQHIGSGILDEKLFVRAIKKLLQTAKRFDNLDFIDFGGGFGVPYKPEEKLLDIQKLGSMITKEVEAFVQFYGKQIQIKFEPGRFLVAESGVFLASVVDIKKTPYKTFVGLNAGMNQLVRPAMYGASHEIINASNVLDTEEVVSVVGNICESADFFARDRKLSHCTEGDVIAMLDAGAYGYVMSSFYNGRPLPAEVLVEGENSRLIREERGV